MTIINKDWEQVLEISTPDIEVKYWVNTPQLRTWVEVLWWSWWLFYIWNDSLSSTWNKIISWIWFKPKYIEIYARMLSWWENSYSNWYSDWLNNFCILYFWDNLYNWWSGYSGTNIIELYWNTSWYEVEAQLISLDNDWFTLSCTSRDVSNIFIYKCFW